MTAVRQSALLVAVVLIACLLGPVPVASAKEPCGSQVARIGAGDEALAGSRPVLFVHGIGSSRRAWNSTGLPEAVTETYGFTTWTFDYGTVSYEWVTHPKTGPKLAEAIECLARKAGRSVIVVAHSMGGLATQFAVAKRSPEGLRISDHVAEVVTIGTPFQGSKLLSLLQMRRKAGRLLPPSETSAAVDALLSYCAADAKQGDNTCGILNAFESPVGQSLRENSKQIRELPRWPKKLPVLPIGGDIQFGTGIRLWKIKLGPTQSLGDPLVAMESATAHAVDEKPMKLRCPILNLFAFRSSPCYHGKLTENDDVREAVVEVVKKVQATPTGTVFYTRYDPATYRSDLFTKTGNRPARRLAKDVGFLASVSPDGRQRAWTDWPSDGPAKLMISDIDGGNAREVATGVNHHGLCNHPAWAPDSRHVLFQIRAETRTAHSQWASVDSTTGAKSKLRPIKSVCYPVWSPDGEAIAWQTSPPPDASSIVITDAKGRDARNIPDIQGRHDPCNNAVVALSPGGRYAVVDEAIEGRRGCGAGVGWGIAGSGVLVDTHTGQEVRTAPAGRIRAGAFLPDGSLLAVTVGESDFVLLDPHHKIAARFPTETLDGEVKVYAYLPN